MRKAIVAILLLLPTSVAWTNDCVVLLHGLARTSASLNKMEQALVEDGYSTANLSYPSRNHPIEELAKIAIDPGLEKCRESADTEKIHFVTHSLGGILVRQYLSVDDIDELGRVVMLGPPNQGSAAADKMRGLPGFDWINGPAGKQLGKGENSVPLKLGPADFELGVIAGNRTIDPLTSAVLENPDDGRVSVKDTRLEGMDDFVIVRHSHAFMMRKRTTIELTKRFLRTGQFDADEE